MLVLVDLFKFEVIVAPKLGVASSHGVGGLQQVVAEIAVAGFDHFGMLGFKVTGLVPVPDKTGKFGNRGLRVKTMDIADFSDDTSGVDLANAGDGGQCIRDDFKLLLNGFVQNLDLFLQCTHRSDRNGHSLIHGIVYSDWQAVRISSCNTDSFCLGCRVCKVSASFINKCGQFF